MFQSQWIELTVALICTILASLFVVVKTALTRSPRGRAEGPVESGTHGAGRIRLIVQDPTPSTNAVMLTRMSPEAMTMALVALVVLQNVEGTASRLVTLVTILLVVLLILQGAAPRTIGRQHPERIMKSFAPLISLLTTALGLVMQLMILFGNAPTPGRGFSNGLSALEAELRDLVDITEASEMVGARESKVIHSVFELGDTLIKEVMVPHIDMVWVPKNRTLKQLLSLALRSGFSHIPVVGDDGIDDVLGVVYLKNVTRRVYGYPDAERSETVRDLMHPASFVPDSKPASELLRDMQLRHSHLVIIIDEFGDTASLRTMEDIVGETVGKIVSEYDHEIPTIAELPEPEHYRISSRLPVDELGELFSIPLQDEEVDTVGGLMAKLLSVVPIPGSSVTYEGIEMVANRAVGRRHQIGTVLVCLAPKTSRGEKEEASD